MTEAPPLQVLFLDHTSELGGAERSMLDLLARLDRRRFTPLLATSPGGPLVERARALGVETCLLDVDPAVLTMSREEWRKGRLRFAWKARGLVVEAFRLAALVRRRRVGVIHSNTLKAHVLGSLVAWLSGVPIVWHMRDLPSSRGDSRRLLQAAFGRVRPGIIAISQAVADDLPAELQARTRVVYNGIDLARFDALAGAPATDLQEPGPLIGTVSHLIPWKGQEVFVRAAAQLRTRHPDWRFVVVGDPIFQFEGERRRLEAIAAELALGSQLRFAGHREDVPAVMGALDLFVLPSFYEPFGRVLIEAMAAGTPIVASRAGGVPEIVIDGESGVLVPPGEVEVLAAAIESLMTDPARAETLARAARRRVESCFSLEATVQGVVAAYRDFGLLPSP